MGIYVVIMRVCVGVWFSLLLLYVGMFLMVVVVESGMCILVIGSFGYLGEVLVCILCVWGVDIVSFDSRLLWYMNIVGCVSD